MKRTLHSPRAVLPLLACMLLGAACAQEPTPSAPTATLQPAPGASYAGATGAGDDGPAAPAPPARAQTASPTRRAALEHLQARRQERLDANVGPCKTSSDCPSAATCEHAVCLCDRGSQACGGTCISRFDSKNCGACGTVCSDVCLDHLGAPRCGTCEAPYAACAPGSGACTNLDSDSRNCGACNHACGAGTACDRGQCVAQRTLGAACTSDGQCAGVNGSCVGEGSSRHCACTGSYRARNGACTGSGPSF